MLTFPTSSTICDHKIYKQRKDELREMTKCEVAHVYNKSAGIKASLNVFIINVIILNAKPKYFVLLDFIFRIVYLVKIPNLD